jgi:hypothetical protein
MSFWRPVVHIIPRKNTLGARLFGWRVFTACDVDVTRGDYSDPERDPMCEECMEICGWETDRRPECGWVEVPSGRLIHDLDEVADD